MGDNENCSALHERVHALLDESLSTGVDRACGLVQDQHGRICDGRSCDRQELALSLREICAVCGEHGVIAVFQVDDETVGVGQLSCCVDLLIGGVQLSVADIVHNRACEQVGVLQNYGLRAAQVALLDLVDVDAVVADLSVRHIVEAVDQVGDSGLSGAGRANEGDLLAGLCVEADAVEDGLVGLIAEINVVQLDISTHLGVGDSAVSLVGVPPSPAACALLGLGDVALFVDLGVYQSNVSVVSLGLLVDNCEDPLRTGKSCEH